MDESHLLIRGRNNIHDAHFIRQDFIAIAFVKQRWNMAIHQTHQAFELLLKGMICLTGTPPCRTHEAYLLVDQLFDILEYEPDGSFALPVAIFVSLGRADQGYGLWLRGKVGELVRRDSNTYTVLSLFPVGELLKADRSLRITLEVRDCTIRVQSEGKDIWSHTDATYSGPASITREIVRQPTTQEIDNLKRLGNKLRAKREKAFYSEHIFRQSDADDAVAELDEAIEIATCFLVDVSLE